MDVDVIGIAVLVFVVVVVNLGLGDATFVVIVTFNSKLPITQTGYLHLLRALLISSSSFCSGCVLVQTMLVPCTRVYLSDRLQWLFQWSYWSVCVGFP